MKFLIPLFLISAFGLSAAPTREDLAKANEMWAVFDQTDRKGEALTQRFNSTSDPKKALGIVAFTGVFEAYVDLYLFQFLEIQMLQTELNGAAGAKVTPSRIAVEKAIRLRAKKLGEIATGYSKLPKDLLPSDVGPYFEEVIQRCKEISTRVSALLEASGDDQAVWDTAPPGGRPRSGATSR
jgi:hypothetical protein